MELNFRRESVIGLGDAIENSPESYSSIYKAKQRINIDLFAFNVRVMRPHLNLWLNEKIQ
ncbi:TPA_asm: hypothetical protein G4P47_002572 [Salmonella enterica subsp. enterica serovar Javiana]|uniref:Uncharacterized protein n=1 Tax=Salmonella enterica subsp. enterica serovar Javiana TaxID=363569 RepID=A0A736UCY6_SALET|nr:hypothetical protein [Salmonella enterica subsp. enterica serovar Javiana]HAE7703613.1 hypothetical protein [Salmonella enterica subsp. enterica serovar Javiana]